MTLPSRGHFSEGPHTGGWPHAGGWQEGAGDEGRAPRAPCDLGHDFCNYKESSHLRGPAPAPCESATARPGAPTHHAPTRVRGQPRRARPEPRLTARPGLQRAERGLYTDDEAAPPGLEGTVSRGGARRGPSGAPPSPLCGVQSGRRVPHQPTGEQSLRAERPRPPRGE